MLTPRRNFSYFCESAADGADRMVSSSVWPREGMGTGTGTARPRVAVVPCATRSCKREPGQTLGWKEAGSFRIQPFRLSLASGRHVQPHRLHMARVGIIK